MARASRTEQATNETTEPDSTAKQADTTADNAAQITAEPADLPATLYKRKAKLNPRLADARLAIDNPTKADGSPQWFRLKESDEAAAKATANLLRRAGQELGTKLSVKTPKTEPGTVYFRRSDKQ